MKKPIPRESAVLRYLRLLPLFALLPPLAITHARTPTRPPVQTSTISRGVKLTLIVPRETYPRNALVRITIRATNLGHKPVHLTGQGSDFCVDNPSLEVSDGHGHLSQLSTYALFSPPSCPPPVGYRTLSPGKTMQWRQYVILSDRVLVATLVLGSLGSANEQLSTPPLTTRLLQSRQATVTFHQDAGAAYADVKPAGRTAGPLRFIESAQCPEEGGRTAVHTRYDWVPVSGTHIVPPCSAVTEWHLIAGWENGPVGTLDYP